MPDAVLSAFFQRLFRKLRAQDACRLPDSQLLAQFVERRDEAAFEALIRKHGPMVLAVCQRALSHAQDAEDAFQATFLVFVRKAHAISRRQCVGTWLYRVAYRTARRAKALRAMAEHRLHACQHLTRPAMTEPEADRTWQDLKPVIDEEVDRLPEKYRSAIVLCYFEGKTKEKAAQELGWPEGTVSGRLARARELLRSRLSARGVTLSAAVLSSALTQSTVEAAVPIHLLTTTVQANVALAAGQALAAGIISANAMALMKGVLNTMWMTKLKVVSGLLLAVGVAGAGTGVAASLASKTTDAQEKSAPVAQAKPKPAAQPKSDKELLQGKWRLIEREVDGKRERISKHQSETILTFRKDKLFLSVAAKGLGGFAGVFQCNYALDPNKKPKQIVVTMEFPDSEQSRPGTYSIDGERLTLTFFSPTDVFTRPGTKPELQIFRRIGVEEDDRQELQGAWVGVTQERNSVRKSADHCRIAVDGDRMFMSGEGGLECRFVLDGNGQPRILNLEFTTDLGKVRKKRMIYELKGDQLKICSKPGEELPTEFASKPGTGDDLVTFKRDVQRNLSRSNLKEIAVAMEYYANDARRLPSSRTQDGKPILSWRVELLPYLGEDQLYKQFKFNEPWDSPHNLALAKKMPRVYAAPLDENGKSPAPELHTFYQVFVGGGSVFDREQSERLSSLFGGLSETILVVEAGEPVFWTKPDDIPYDATKQMPKVGGLFKDGFHAVFADGSVRFLKRDFPAETLRHYIKRAGKESPPLPIKRPPG